MLETLKEKAEREKAEAREEELLSRLENEGYDWECDEDISPEYRGD